MLETSARLLRLLGLLQSRPQVLPSRLAQRLAALQHATVALDSPEPAIDPALLTLLAAACRAHQRVRLRYTDRGGTGSQRHIEPYRLVSGGYRWYLMAFDIDRADWRTFRVDRISERRDGLSPAGAGRGVHRDQAARTDRAPAQRGRTAAARG